MADTVTPVLGLTKPEVGASDDTWGDKLNANMDILDSKIVPNTGGTYTGSVTFGAASNSFQGPGTVTGTEYGKNDPSGHYVFFDFHTGVNPTDFDSRIGFSGTAGVDATITFYADATAFVSQTAFAYRPTFNGNTPWDTGNLNPANYALLTGATFTGSVYAKENLVVNRNGTNWSWVTIDADAAANSIVNFQADGYSNWQITRNATSRHLFTYRFDATGNYISAAQYYDWTTGQSVFTVRPQWAGYTPWDTGNFNPANYAALTGAAFTGGVSAPDIAVLNAYQFKNAALGVGLKNADIYHDATETVFRVIDDAYSSVLRYPIRVNRTTGVTTLHTRPVFGTATPWDTDNLSPGQILVASGSVTSNVANIEITVPAGYKSFHLVVRGMRPNVDGGHVAMQAKMGGSWLASAGNYGWNQTYWSTGSGGAFSKWDYTYGSGLSYVNCFVVGSGLAMAASTSDFWVADISPGMTGRVPSIMSKWMYGTNGGQGNGYVNSLGRIEAIRLLFTSGNIAECHYDLYGAF